MKRSARTIVFILILALLPGTAGASTGSPAPMTFQTSDQLSELYQLYTIKHGDCLISIGKQFGVPWQDIAELNGIRGPEYTIIAGHTLKIPNVSKQQDTAGNYLILCETEAQKQCLNEFAAFKRLNGFAVSIESVEGDVKPAADADRSEAIRQYLKKMDRMLSLEYVLLIGDPYNEESCCRQHTGGIIPMRYMYNNDDNTPTDIYYVFDINWDSEGDGDTGEMDEVVDIFKQAKPEPLFLLGRIPFSDTKDIGTVLNATMQYEQSKKAHSNALIESLGGFSFYGEALTKNLAEANIETTAICNSAEPSENESTYLNSKTFNEEINKGYDFVYTDNNIPFYLAPDKSAPMGLLFMDSSSSMLVEPRNVDVSIEDFLTEGTVCASIATTRGVGFNPENPYPRMASLLFTNGTLCVSREFYAVALSRIADNNPSEAYVYCYIGDPSIELSTADASAGSPAPLSSQQNLPEPAGNAGSYLILCETEAQKQCLNEFAEFKKLRGFTVTVKSVENDVKLASNADPCEAIRQYLKKMDEKLSLEYVLLVGNPYDEESRCPQHTGGVIPMRYLYGISINHKTKYDGSWYDYQDQSNNAFNTPTDIYYAVDFNWDYDADGYAGEEDEVAESVKQAEPKLLFLLGRIPFSDTKDIETMLNATMQYEQSQKAHSDALVGSIGDWAFFGDALAKNLTEAKMKTTTIYDGTDAEYYKLESTYPLSKDNFNQEINKKYDFVYTNNDTAFYNFELVPDKGVQIGLYFMDDTSAMLVEPGLDKVHIQDFLADGTVGASIATTRDIGFNPKNPAPRMASLLFKNKSLCVSREFYDAELSMIVNNNVLESYIYCYLGDPSIELKP